jgi:hypothetical protein
MAGTSNLSDTIKHAVTDKIIASISQAGSSGKGDERTIFGVKLNPDEFEKVSHAIAGAAAAIGPIIAKSREKTVEAANNAPGIDRFEEQFSSVIEAVDKRQAEARERVRASALSAREATAQAVHSARDATASTANTAREATLNAAANAREATTNAATTAREATSHAAAETVDASKNLLGLLFWLGALGAAVYYLLLNPERREQAINAAKSTVNVARGIVTEVRGEDGVFHG